MVVDRLTRNLRVLLRTNGIMAELHLRAAVAKASLNILAGLVACFGLLMLDIAFFFVLEDLWGRISAAAAIGFGNLALALLLVLLAGLFHPGRELELAQEVHDTAMQAVLDDVRQAPLLASGLLKNPLDAAISGLIGHLAAALIKHLKS